MRYILFCPFGNEDGWLKMEAILSGMSLPHKYIPDNLQGWAYLVECEEHDLVMIKLKNSFVGLLHRDWYREEHFEFLEKDWDFLHNKYDRR